MHWLMMWWPRQSCLARQAAEDERPLRLASHVGAKITGVDPACSRLQKNSRVRLVANWRLGGYRLHRGRMHPSKG